MERVEMENRNGSEGVSSAWEHEEVVLRCCKCGGHLGYCSTSQETQIRIICKRYECKIINVFNLVFDGRSIQIAQRWEPKPIHMARY